MDNEIRTEKDVVRPDPPECEDDIYFIYFWQ